MEWTWSNGTTCERTLINIQKQQMPYHNIVSPEIQELQKTLNANNAFLQSLHCDEAFDYNKRENSYNKLAEREPISQIGKNPFFENLNENKAIYNENHYVNDVSIQDQYLKPICTTFPKNS